jgi:hypothetical protein
MVKGAVPVTDLRFDVTMLKMLFLNWFRAVSVSAVSRGRTVLGFVSTTNLLVPVEIHATRIEQVCLSSLLVTAQLVAHYGDAGEGLSSQNILEEKHCENDGD